MEEAFFGVAGDDGMGILLDSTRAFCEESVEDDDDLDNVIDWTRFSGLQTGPTSVLALCSGVLIS